MTQPAENVPGLDALQASLLREACALLREEGHDEHAAAFEQYLVELGVWGRS